MSLSLQTYQPVYCWPCKHLSKRYLFFRLCSKKFLQWYKRMKYPSSSIPVGQHDIRKNWLWRISFLSERVKKNTGSLCIFQVQCRYWVCHNFHCLVYFKVYPSLTKQIPLFYYHNGFSHPSSFGITFVILTLAWSREKKGEVVIGGKNPQNFLINF